MTHLTQLEINSSHGCSESKEKRVKYYHKTKKVYDLDNNLIGYGEWDKEKRQLKVRKNDTADRTKESRV